jgi:hypothetical protein
MAASAFDLADYELRIGNVAYSDVKRKLRFHEQFSLSVF